MRLLQPFLARAPPLPLALPAMGGGRGCGTGFLRRLLAARRPLGIYPELSSIGGPWRPKAGGACPGPIAAGLCGAWTIDGSVLMGPAACFRRPCWPWPPRRRRFAAPQTSPQPVATLRSLPSSGLVLFDLPFIPANRFVATTDAAWLERVREQPVHWRPRLSHPTYSGLAGDLAVASPWPTAGLAGAVDEPTGAPFGACGVPAKLLPVPRPCAAGDVVGAVVAQGPRVWARAWCVLLPGANGRARKAWRGFSGCRPPALMPCWLPPLEAALCQLHSPRGALQLQRPLHRSAGARTAGDSCRRRSANQIRSVWLNTRALAPSNGLWADDC